MFRYSTIDVLPEELYQDVIIPDPYEDTELDLTRDPPAEKKLRLDGRTLTVQMNLPEVLAELWDYVRGYVEQGSFYDPVEVDDAVWLESDYELYPDEELESIPEDAERLSEKRWRTRLRIFMAACKQAALPEVMNYIAKAVPKTDDGLLEPEAEIDIAMLALVDENRECHRLKAKVTGLRKIQILLETEVMTCATTRKANEDVSARTNFFRDLPRRRAAAKSGAAQSLPQSDEETDARYRLPALTFTQEETFELNDELRITVPDGYHYCKNGDGVNAGWCYIVPESTPLTDNHIDASPYSFGIAAKPLEGFPFHMVLMEEMIKVLEAMDYLQKDTVTIPVARSEHCAFLYQSFYDYGDLTYNKLKGFLVADEHLYQMHIYANHSVPISQNQSVLDQFHAIGRSWMERVSLIGNESWSIQPVKGKNTAEATVKAQPRAAAQPQAQKTAEATVKAQPRAAAQPQTQKPAPAAISTATPSVSEYDAVIMYALLSNELRLIKLNRPQEEFCEIYSDQFPALSNEAIIQLRERVIKEMNNNAKREFYEARLMRESCSTRFKLTTLNLYNVSDKDIEVAAPWAIQGTRKWFREDEREKVNTLMDIELSKTRRMLDKKLEQLDSRLTDFSTVKSLLRIVISDRQEDASEVIQNASHFQLDIEACTVYVEIAAPNPKCADIALHNYFTWYWYVTVRDIWEAAAANGFQDRRSNPSNGVAYVEQALNRIRYPQPRSTQSEMHSTPASAPSTEQPVQPAAREGCYIATAVYGSYDAPEVLTLRRFRDETLRSTALGRWFIRAYYRLSPPVAARLRHAKHINAAVRSVLDRLVAKLDSK